MTNGEIIKHGNKAFINQTFSVFEQLPAHPSLDASLKAFLGERNLDGNSTRKSVSVPTTTSEEVTGRTLPSDENDKKSTASEHEPPGIF